MPDPISTIGAIAASAIAFTEIWSDHHTQHDLAGKLTLTEISALADLLAVCGHDVDDFLALWIELECDDGEADEGDWVVVDHELKHVAEYGRPIESETTDG